MCSNDEFLASECKRYINQLEIPKGFETETIIITGAVSMTSGYNYAMKQTDAKYKIYLHQDVLLIYRNLLTDMLSIFSQYPDVGMLGVVGNKSLAEDGCPWSDGMWRRIGQLYADLIYKKYETCFSRIHGAYQEAIVLDGLFLATQYDLPWREDLFTGWDFYDCSQALEFWKAGYKVVVPNMKQTWCLHDNDILHLQDYEKYRKVFHKEYHDFYVGWHSKDEAKNVIFQKFRKGDTPFSFPYPPVYKEEHTDYICFTDDKEVHSNFWEIVFLDSLEQQEKIEERLQIYANSKELAPNQIQTKRLFTDQKGIIQIENGKVFSDEGIVTIPELTELPYCSFDKEKFVSTVNEQNQYIYEPNPVYKGGPYNGRELLLTIGVPVSNQIATIDRCLSHLKPLLDAIDSELLVIDTGSTDGTVEVCRSYGARVIEFPWCDNMSAARNQGIYHAKGEWYMSIDDDEWFDDVTEFIKFFQSGMYKKVDMATYIQRSYIHGTGEVYTDNHTMRMARITPELHFEGRIHDCLVTPASYTNGYEFSAFANHYGFVRDDMNKVMKKSKRNIALLIYDVYDMPWDMRYNFQLANEFESMLDWRPAEKLFYRGISVCKELGNVNYGRLHVSNLIATLHNARDIRLFDTVKFLMKEYEYTDAEMAFFHYALMELGILYNHPLEEILENYNSYIKYREDYEKNPVKSNRYTFNGLHVCTNESYRMDANVMAFYTYAKLHKNEEALLFLEKIIPEKMCYQHASFFKGMMAADEPVFLFAIEKLQPTEKELWFKELLDCAMELFDTDDEEKGFSRLSLVVQNICIDKLYVYIQNMWANEAFQEKIKVIQRFVQATDISKFSVQENYFYGNLILNCWKNEQDLETRMELFLLYIDLMGRFAQEYYSQSVLSMETQGIIAGNIRAAYDIYLAVSKTKLESGDIRRIRDALRVFPAFKREIQVLLDVL